MLVKLSGLSSGTQSVVVFVATIVKDIRNEILISVRRITEQFIGNGLAEILDELAGRLDAIPGGRDDHLKGATFVNGEFGTHFAMEIKCAIANMRFNTKSG